MSKATIEYKNSPNESTAYAVSEGQKTKVQLVATPAGDLELADNPNVDTGYLVINGEKHKCALVAEVAGELKLPTSATDDSGYVTTQDGRQHKVKLVANITSGGGGGGVQINNQDINVTQNGIYRAEEGYTGLGTVNVNVASGSPTRFGVGIGNLLGTVDADGNYVVPSEPVEINLAGIKSVPDHGFNSAFFDIRNIAAVKANDVTSVGEYAFNDAFASAIARTTPVTMYLSFDNLEVVDSIYSFYSACSKRMKVDVSFKKLKKVTGNNAFKYFSSATFADFDKMFPSLEEIAGDSTFASAFGYEDNCTVTLTKLKKITGKSSKYYSVFGDPNRIVIWNFPNATEFTGYIWGTSFAGEIHFAAANQAAIEACEGYSYKWGFTNATIYFDL